MLPGTTALPLPCSALLCSSEDPCNVVDCSRNGASNGGLDKAERAELSVSRIASMMLVGPGGLLTLQNIILSDIASADQYVYSDAQVSNQCSAADCFFSSAIASPSAVLQCTACSCAAQEAAIHGQWHVHRDVVHLATVS